jgi:hypothetical protein
MKNFGKMVALVAGALTAAGVAAAESREIVVPATIVYEEKATDISTAKVQGAELWISMADLTRATDFELKPQGVCRNELCFPLPKERRAEFVRDEGGAKSFHLTEFAKLVGQPFATNALEEGGKKVWYFGLRADQRQGLGSLKAPNFALPDMAGKMHSLTDFRGKKVLLVTWASW